MGSRMVICLGLQQDKETRVEDPWRESSLNSVNIARMRTTISLESKLI